MQMSELLKNAATKSGMGPRRWSPKRYPPGVIPGGPLPGQTASSSGDQRIKEEESAYNGETD